MEFLRKKEGDIEALAAFGDMPEAVHQFEAGQIRAIDAALAARRPLLVRGEPGIGKSQLARAAAKALGRAFLQHVVDARTESRDLLWHFDAVARLADAQLLGALGDNATAMVHSLQSAPDPDSVAGPQRQGTLPQAGRLLDVNRYLHPRVLWWAFHWTGAKEQAERVGATPPPQVDGGDPDKGCLVLIDEIDKAEADVPNGLLAALGEGRFQPPGRARPVSAAGIAPLVVITTNEERALPDAFVRRCLVLHLGLPRERDALIERLKQRGRTHFGDQTSDKVLETAAGLLADDRQTAKDRHWRPLPGQAEYLDLLRAVIEQARNNHKEQEKLLEQVACFVLRKHPDAAKAGAFTP